jgi:hypothetical protein
MRPGMTAGHRAVTGCSAGFSGYQIGLERPARCTGGAAALRDRLRMPAAEGPRGIFRARKAPDAADAGCIGKSGNAPGAEKHRGTDPPSVLRRSLRRDPTEPRTRAKFREETRLQIGVLVRA